MKKVLSIVLALSLVLGSFSMAFAGTTSDYVGTDYEDAVETLKALGIVAGYDDEGNIVKPMNTIKREEFAKLMVVALGLEDLVDYAKNSTQFTDVPENSWAKGYINVATAQGLYQGRGNGTFGYGDKINYGEAITVIVRALGYEDEHLAGQWPYNFIVKAKDLDITDGVAIGEDAAIRGNIFKMLDNSLTLNMVKYDEDGNEKEKEDTLLSKLDVEKLTEKVVEIPRTDSKLDDNEIELANGDEVTVSEDFDMEAVFGLEITVWVNDDSEVMDYDVEDEALFDALAWDADDEELTLVDADETYDMVEDAVVYVNGEKDDIADADYAKVVLNDDEEVMFVDAYTWDNSLVVEDVDDTDVVGYDDTAADETIDLEDYTIVKDGKTVSIDDIDAEDVLYYNEDAEYAEVYNNTVEGEVTAVFANDFDLDDDNYTTAGTYIEAGDDVENIDVLDTDALDSMKDAEEEVRVFLDRNGDVRHVVGDLDEEDTSTLAGYVIRDVEQLSSVRSTTYNVDVVTENGEFIEYDVEKADLDEDTVTFSNGGANTDIAKGDIVEITYDEDGDIDEVVAVGAHDEKVTTASSDDIDVADDKYTDNGYRLEDSAVVFDIQDYTDDTDDIAVSKYSELDFDTVEEGFVFADSDDYVTYMVVTKTDKEVTELTGVITEVKKLSNGNYRTWISVDGEEKRDDLDTKYAEGKVVDFEIDEDEAFENISIVSADKSGEIADISNRNKTFDVGTEANLELTDGAYIFDLTDDDEDVVEIELDEIEEGETVKAYFEGNSSRFVEYLFVTSDAVNTGGDTGSQVDYTDSMTVEAYVNGGTTDRVRLDGDVYDLDALTIIEEPTVTYSSGSFDIAYNDDAYSSSDISKGDKVQIKAKDGYIQNIKLLPQYLDTYATANNTITVGTSTVTLNSATVSKGEAIKGYYTLASNGDYDMLASTTTSKKPVGLKFTVSGTEVTESNLTVSGSVYGSETIDVAALYGDSDIEIAATPSITVEDTSVATATTGTNDITVTAVAEGTTTVDVTFTQNGETVTDTIDVNVVESTLTIAQESDIVKADGATTGSVEVSFSDNYDLDPANITVVGGSSASYNAVSELFVIDGVTEGDTIQFTAPNGVSSNTITLD
ncbi:MAG: hypothetical protein FH753_10190 [Firmicutes bacterium]|nr:hypothetical protein [Bacillota bacterium]